MERNLSAYKIHDQKMTTDAVDVHTKKNTKRRLHRKFKTLIKIIFKEVTSSIFISASYFDIALGFDVT